MLERMVELADNGDGRYTGVNVIFQDRDRVKRKQGKRRTNDSDDCKGTKKRKGNRGDEQME